MTIDMQKVSELLDSAVPADNLKAIGYLLDHPMQFDGLEERLLTLSGKAGNVGFHMSLGDYADLCLAVLGLRQYEGSSVLVKDQIANFGAA